MSAGSKRASSNTERRAKVAELKAAQERSDRRRTRLIVLAVALVVLALVVPATVLIVRAQQEATTVEAAASEPIEGEEVVEVPSATHVTEDVPYEEVQQVEVEEAGQLLPPLGGDHDPVVQNCGFYDVPVRSENAVHSLEHGAVWLTYRAGLEEPQVAILRTLADENPYLLVSPFDDLASDVVATAWGVQLELDSAQDERLKPFLVRYLQGEQTPEPGALCSGGTDAPAA